MEGSVATYSFFSLGLFSFKTNCLGLWRLRSWENGFSMMRAAVSRTVQIWFPTHINQQEKHRSAFWREWGVSGCLLSLSLCI